MASSVSQVVMEDGATVTYCILGGKVSPLYCLRSIESLHLWDTGDPQTVAIKSPK